MKRWLRRIRAAFGMGLTWAVGWAPVGALISVVFGFVVGTPGANVDRWVMTLTVLGFLGGAIFSTVLRIAEGRRRFDELSLPRFGAWGAVGGLLLGVVAVWGGLLGAGFGTGLWIQQAVIVGTACLLGAGSAAGSLAVARMSDDRELLEAGAEVAAVGLTDEEVRELISAGS